MLVVANISTHAGFGGGGGTTADHYDRSIIKSYEAVMVPITTSEPPTIAYLRRSWGDLWSQNHPSMSQKGVRVTASVGARRRTAP